MNWNNEPWRKLYTKITGDWQQLSVMARGMSGELLKYAKDDGSICRTRGKAPALAVALVLNPRPEELEAVQNGSQELLDDGYLAVVEGVVYIRNFEDAQERRTPAAAKQQRYRDRKNAETNTSDGNAALPPLPGSDPNRNDTKRYELYIQPSPPLTGKLPGSPNATTKAAVDRWRTVAETVLDSLNTARKRVRPQSRGISPTYDSLRHIADRLEAGKSADDCLHVVEICELECRNDPSAFKWFDAVSPFRPDNFERKCAADPGAVVARQVLDSRRSLPLSTSVTDETRKARKF